MVIDAKKLPKRVRHKKTGNIYIATGLCRMQNPADGTWVDAVMYYAVERDTEDPSPFVQAISSFIEKFEDARL